MWSALSMLSFASFSYVVSLGFAIGAVCMATFALVDVFEKSRVAPLLMRTPVRIVWSLRELRVALAWSISGGRRVLVMIMSGLLLVVGCYTIVVGMALSIAAGSTGIPDWLILAVSAIAGAIVGGASLVYVGSGGRLGGSVAPAMDVRPWVVESTARMRIAAAVLRLRLIEAVIVLFAPAAAVAAFLHAVGGPDPSLGKPVEPLYLAGIVPMVAITWLGRRLLPWAFPRLAALLLLLETVDPRTAAVAPLRTALTGLCRLVDRCAVIDSRRDAAAGVHNPRSVVLRSVAANLRTYLSNKSSVGVQLDAVHDDLIMVAVFLGHPNSVAAFERLAVRMGAFSADGSPRDVFRSEHPVRLGGVLNKLLIGLERTHQGFMRALALAAVVVVIVLFVSGALNIADVIKVVKL